MEFSCKNSQQLGGLNYFRKKAPLQIFDRFPYIPLNKRRELSTIKTTLKI